PICRALGKDWRERQLATRLHPETQGTKACQNNWLQTKYDVPSLTSSSHSKARAQTLLGAWPCCVRSILTSMYKALGGGGHGGGGHGGGHHGGGGGHHGGGHGHHGGGGGFRRGGFRGGRGGWGWGPGWLADDWSNGDFVEITVDKCAPGFVAADVPSYLNGRPVVVQWVCGNQL